MNSIQTFFFISTFIDEAFILVHFIYLFFFASVAYNFVLFVKPSGIQAKVVMKSWTVAKLKI